MEVDTRKDDQESSSDGLLERDVKQEAVSPSKAPIDGLGEVERLVYSYVNAEGRGVAMVRRTKGEGKEFLQITDKQTDAQSYFSNLVVIVTVGREGTVFRLLTSRHRRLVKEVTVAAGGWAEVGGQLRATLAYCLMESAADRYTECQGAFEEESYVGDFSVLDPRHLLVESSDAGVVYRARSCPALIPKEAGSVCEACSQLRTQHAQSIEQFEQEEEEEEDNMGMLSQYLEVSMEDGADEHKPVPETDLKEQQWRPRTNIGILRQGLESNPMHAFKPKLSYKKLISMAIKDSHYKMLKLTDIYAWILARYPGFNSNRTGFQNSVRHNLSLNKVFIKVNLPGVANNGKGNYWTINPKFEDSSNTVPGPGHRDPILESRQLAQRLASVSPNLSVTPCSPQLSLTDKTGLKEERKEENLDAGDDDFGADAKPLSENPNISITKVDGGHDFSDGLVLDKPNFSYKELIMIAIFCDPTLQVCLNDIYLTIKHWFPYFQQRSVGLTWQNSVRHNLSLNKCFHRIAPALSPFRPDRPASSTKGGSWTFSEHDETWRRLVTTPKKWSELRATNNGSSEPLLHFLANRSPEFRNYVYTKIYSEGELQFTGPIGDEAKEAADGDNSEQAAIVNNSEKVEPVSAKQPQQQAEPVDLMSRNSPLATPPPPPTESTSVEEESMQSGAEEKGEEVEEGREEGGGGGYSDGTSYGSTLGESYLEESRKEAAAVLEKPHHPNLLEKESYSGYREEMGGGKDSYQGGGGGGGSKESYHHGVSSYMGVPNSYMGGAGSRMDGGERERCNTGERDADHIVMSGECEIGDYPGPGYQEVQPRPVYQEPPRAHPGYQNPGYPPGYQAYLPHNVASLSQQHAAWHLGTR